MDQLSAVCPATCCVACEAKAIRGFVACIAGSLTAAVAVVGTAAAVAADAAAYRYCVESTDPPWLLGFGWEGVPAAVWELYATEAYCGDDMLGS